MTSLTDLELLLLPEARPQDKEKLPCCSFFGCGKQLSLVERLCGNNCIDHMGKNKTQITTGKL
jgi:hypothetical protein